MHIQLVDIEKQRREKGIGEIIPYVININLKLATQEMISKM